MPGRRYTAEIAGQRYDVIIVGSGLGGLTTAAFLARQGLSVILFERHDVPGGFTHTFQRKGYEWDVGVHYVGQVGDEKNLMRRVFDYVTDGELKWASMGDVYDRVVIAGTTYDFVKGYDNQIQQLLRHFPQEEAAIRAYFQLVRGFSLSSGLFFGERSMPAWLSATVGIFMRHKFARRAARTTYVELRQLTDNERLIAVLCAQCGDYGLPPRRSSFAIHAALVDHYLNGGYYPVGGARAIHVSMLRGIEARGGALIVGAEVASLLVKKGCAIGVRMKNGDEVYARKVISNAGARNTFKHLWPAELPLPPRIASDLEAIRPSVAHVCLYVGLSASDADLDLPKHNVWLYDTYDFDGQFERRDQDPSTDPWLTYVYFPSAKDPSWPARHPGKSTVQVIAPCPYEWVESWQEKPWMKRGADYVELKERWQNSLLEKLYSVAPKTRGQVAHCEVSTPLSTRHFSNYDKGEIYGLEHTPQRMQARWLRAHTPIKNLFLTGQDIVMVGVGGALFSGVITAVAVLRRNVLWSVFTKRKTEES